jgi:hypothetical protein
MSLRGGPERHAAAALGRCAPALLVVALAAGCTGAPTAAGSATPAGTPGRVAAGPSWTPVTPPATGTGRPVVRDVAACAGRWYAAGGYLAPDGSTRPALWTSGDAHTWVESQVRPVSVYGPSQLLTSVACRDALVVAIGTTSGGVHANPRVSTWAGAPDGPLAEQPAPFELFGGPDAIGVSRLAATAGPLGGPTALAAPGWLILGAWQDANGQAGAAVWVAPDGRAFQRVDADPALESGPSGLTTARDAIAGPGGFTMVGSAGTQGGKVADRAPAVWTSPDGLRWQRAPVPAGGEDEEPQRVLADPRGLLAVGVRGGGFGAWHGPAADGSGAWRATGRFGTFTGTGLPMVTGLAAGPSGDDYALAGDGARYRLWSSPDGTAWTERQLPAAVPDDSVRRAALAGAGGRLLLAVEDGTTSRLWVG